MYMYMHMYYMYFKQSCSDNCFYVDLEVNFITIKRIVQAHSYSLIIMNNYTKWHNNYTCIIDHNVQQWVGIKMSIIADNSGIDLHFTVTVYTCILIAQFQYWH